MSRRTLRPPVALVLWLVVVSCGGEGGTSPPDDPIQRVTVTPAEARVAVGRTVTLSALVVTRGGEDVSSTASVTWSVSPADVTTVQGSGAIAQVTGIAIGTATVRATVEREIGQATVTVFDPLTLLTTSLPRGVLGQAYDVTLEAEGGDGSHMWDLSSGALPAGLELFPAGSIRGTPDEAGRFDLVLRVRSGDQSEVRTMTLIVTAPAGAATMATDYLVGGSVSIPYEDRIAASGDGTLTFSIIAGAPPPGVTLDGATGTLTGTPTAPGLHYFTVRVQGPSTSDRRTYAVHVSSKPPGAFNMWTMNVSRSLAIPSAAVVAAVEDALARWEDVIVGDLPDSDFPDGTFDSVDCGGQAEKLNGEAFDDMLIMLNLAEIDGPRGTLGSAGPCYALAGATGVSPDLYTTFGRLTLDTEDLANLDAHQLFSLVFHEIGHIVGIGTLWELSDIFGGGDLIAGSGGTDPRYTGQGGNAEFTGTLGGGSAGARRIPIEADGGEGTAYGHWDEGEFDSEIMTGFIEAPGRPIRLSTMTVAAVGDFAYTVDLGAADAYSIPGCAPGCTAAPARAAGAVGSGRVALDDVRRGPILVELPSGEVVRVTPPGGGR